MSDLENIANTAETNKLEECWDYTRNAAKTVWNYAKRGWYVFFPKRPNLTFSQERWDSGKVDICIPGEMPSSGPCKLHRDYK